MQKKPILQRMNEISIIRTSIPPLFHSTNLITTIKNPSFLVRFTTSVTEYNKIRSILHASTMPKNKSRSQPFSIQNNYQIDIFIPATATHHPKEYCKRFFFYFQLSNFGCNKSCLENMP